MSQHRFIKNNKSCARRKIIIMKLQRKSLKCPAKYLLHSFHPPDSTAEDNSSMLHQARWVSPSLDPWTALHEPKWKTTETFCLIQQLMKLKTKAEKLELLPLCISFCFVKRFYLLLSLPVSEQLQTECWLFPTRVVPCSARLHSAGELSQPDNWIRCF